MTRILLDFSNLRVGGALQVASATLADLVREDITAPHPWIDRQLEIWLSPAVYRNLTIDVARLPGRVSVKDTRPTPLALLKRPRHRYDLRFTLFGPTYTGRLAACEIVGFAEVMLVYDRHEYARDVRARGAREWIADKVKRRLVRGYDCYVVETQAIADRLTRRYAIAADRIHVVRNQPHPLFAAAALKTGRAQRIGRDVHVAFPTRYYPHKNLEIVAQTGQRLKRDHALDLTVHTTLRADEWARLPSDARDFMCNHGEVTPPQLLEIYAQVDGIFFPSLLEASSATPLEANTLGIPLVASDRDFVRTSADAFALFDPTDPSDAAKALGYFATNRERAWSEASEIAADRRQSAAMAPPRTQQYLTLISRRLESCA